MSQAQHLEPCVKDREREQQTKQTADDRQMPFTNRKFNIFNKEKETSEF